MSKVHFYLLLFSRWILKINKFVFYSSHLLFSAKSHQDDCHQLKAFIIEMPTFIRERIYYFTKIYIKKIEKQKSVFRSYKSRKRNGITLIIRQDLHSKVRKTDTRMITGRNWTKKKSVCKEHNCQKKNLDAPHLRFVAFINKWIGRLIQNQLKCYFICIFLIWNGFRDFIKN